MKREKSFGRLKLLEHYPVRNNPVPEKRHPVFIRFSARPLAVYYTLKDRNACICPGNAE